MLDSIERLRDCAKRRAITVSFDKTELLDQLDAIEREVEEGYIELPKDENGEQVSIGDTVHDNEEGYDFRVDGFMLWGNTTEWWAFQDQAVQQKLKNCSIVKPPTVEDVLEEMYDMLDDARIPNGSEKRSHEQIIAEYAKRLQLREEG